MNPIDDQTRRKIDLLEHRYADWLRLRAEKAQLALCQSVEEHGRIERELDDLERLFMTTPAPASWAVWLKFEVLEQTLIQDDAGREDRGEVWMLAGIKADLLALGVGEARS